MIDTVRSERFVQGSAAIVPVRDVAVTVAFYVDVFGFETRELSEDGKFGLVACGEVGVMVLQSGDDAALLATSRNISIYIWVDGVDAFYHALKSKLDALPQGAGAAAVRPTVQNARVFRENPDGCLLFFGQEIDS